MTLIQTCQINYQFLFLKRAFFTCQLNYSKIVRSKLGTKTTNVVMNLAKVKNKDHRTMTTDVDLTSLLLN